MEQTPIKKSHGREELKNFFRNGTIPSEIHFGYLIDSSINKLDDGFSKDDENGLHISSQSKRLITLYDKTDELTPFCHVESNDQDIPSLTIRPCREEGTGEDQQEEDSFFFHQGGYLGIGAKSDGKYKLTVKGYAGMEGRLGTYRSGSVPANGKWHKIPGVDHLNNCNAFEIVARTGKIGSGKFALLHATALSAFGPSGGKIRATSACHGRFWNSLSVRWRGKTHDYWLELRSKSNYGQDRDGNAILIYYTLTKLWEDEHLLPANSFYPKND